MWYSCCHRPQVQWPQLGYTWISPQTLYTTRFCSILGWGRAFSIPGFVSLHHNVCLTSASSPFCLTHHDSSPWHLTHQCAYCFCSARAWSSGQHNVSHPSFYLLGTSGIFYLNSPSYPKPEPHRREVREVREDMGPWACYSSCSEACKAPNNLVYLAVLWDLQLKKETTHVSISILSSQLICDYEIPPTRKAHG